MIIKFWAALNELFVKVSSKHWLTSTSNERSLSSRKMTRSRSLVSVETRDMPVRAASARVRRCRSCCSSMSASPLSGGTFNHRTSWNETMVFTRSSSSVPSSSSASSPSLGRALMACWRFRVWPLKRPWSCRGGGTPLPRNKIRNTIESIFFFFKKFLIIRCLNNAYSRSHHFNAKAHWTSSVFK